MPTETIDRVVRTVDLQTTDVQPDKIAADKVVMHLAGHGSETEADVRAALDEAVAEGRLERDEEHVWIPEGEDEPATKFTQRE